MASEIGIAYSNYKFNKNKKKIFFNLLKNKLELLVRREITSRNKGEPSSKAKYYKFSDSEKYCKGKVKMNYK